KGTMSELELSLFRQRSHEALKQKARRGALFLGVAAGYAKAGRDRIEKDPDQRVQDALKLVFSKFAELQSVRQVHIWLRDEGIALPVKSHKAAEGRCIVWKLPLYNTIHNILTNPIYAGAYAFGRTMSKVGYISWSAFGNGKLISDMIAMAPGLTYAGVDVSDTMVSEASESNRALIDEGRVK